MKISDQIENAEDGLDVVLPLEDEVFEIVTKLVIDTDEKHGEIMKKIDHLMDLNPELDSFEGKVLVALVDAVVAYEEIRWPIL
jgi:hypothetical protein